MQPLIAVLAGGASTRMGTEKAFVRVDGVTMLDRVCAVGAAVGDVVVVGGLQSDRWEVITDLRPGPLGPMAGLEAALAHGEGRDVVLVGVDQPFVRGPTLARLVEQPGDVVVPVDGGRDQVTCGVYRPGFIPVARAALDLGADLAIHTHLGRVETTRVLREQWSAWGEDGRSWFSADTRDALAAGLERYGD